VDFHASLWPSSAIFTTKAPMPGTDLSTQPKRENLLLNLLFNILLPTLVLSKFSADHLLGPRSGLILALLFPLGYGVYDFVRRKKANFISIIGFVSVLLTGGFGLMKLDGFWFAVKEAAVPAVIGLVILWSQKTSSSLVKELLFNDQVIDVEKVDAALDSRNVRPSFNKLLDNSSYLLVLGFFVSAVLNYGLARYLLKSPAGTPEFNAELGKMNLLSWPVIVLPSMAITMYALYKLLKGIETLTGLSFDEIFRQKKD
jgi:hypothetical protein